MQCATERLLAKAPPTSSLDPLAVSHDVCAQPTLGSDVLRANFILFTVLFGLWALRCSTPLPQSFLSQLHTFTHPHIIICINATRAQRWCSSSAGEARSRCSLVHQGRVGCWQGGGWTAHSRRALRRWSLAGLCSPAHGEYNAALSIAVTCQGCKRHHDKHSRYDPRATSSQSNRIFRPCVSRSTALPRSVRLHCAYATPLTIPTLASTSLSWIGRNKPASCLSLSARRPLPSPLTEPRACQHGCDRAGSLCSSAVGWADFGAEWTEPASAALRRRLSPQAHVAPRAAAQRRPAPLRLSASHNTVGGRPPVRLCSDQHRCDRGVATGGGGGQPTVTADSSLAVSQLRSAASSAQAEAAKPALCSLSVLSFATTPAHCHTPPL